MDTKRLFITAGCNGAGKSTFSKRMLPADMKHLPVFDGDVFYVQKVRKLFALAGAKAAPITISREAAAYVSDLFTERYQEAIGKGAPFAFEGHFTERGQWMPLLDFKNAGYRLEMDYLGLKNVDLSLNRVKERVRKGGHSVEPRNVAHNYYSNAANVSSNHALFDRLTVWDTSRLKPVQLVRIEKGKVIAALPTAKQPQWLREEMPAIYQQVEAFHRQAQEQKPPPPDNRRRPGKRL